MSAVHPHRDGRRVGLALVRIRKARSAQEGAARRRQALAALAGNPRSPACVQANFELGEMLMRTALPQPGLRTPSDYFQAVLDAGESPWKELAAQRLAALSGPKEPDEGTGHFSLRGHRA